MPPSTTRNGRRTVSHSSSPTSFRLHSQSPSNQAPTLLTSSSTSPSPIRRTVSASSAPYPTSRQAIVHARSSTRAHEQTRKVLAEIDWWVVMSGQRDEDEDEYDEDEEEEEEWEQWTMQEDEEPAPTANNTQTDEDTLSEGSEGDDNIDDTTAELSTSHELSEENTDSSRAPSPFFPTTLPPLTPLLSSQVGSEPSRRDSRGRTTSRVYARRPVESGITRLTWDYSTSSMVVTSVPSPAPTTTIGASPTAVASNYNNNRARTPTPSPANALSTPSTPSSPSQGRASSTTPSPCRAQSLCRAFGAAPGSVADSILREAFSTPPSVSLSTSSSKSNSTGGGSRIIDKANSIANIFKICRFPMARVMVSPSILTYR